MAGALVGGAFLSSFLNVLFDRMASPQVVAFFRGQKVNNWLLTRLETAMTSLRVVLDDAEEKQITNQSFLGTCLVKGLSIRYYFYIYSSL
jgi:hypothetical protein